MMEDTANFTLKPSRLKSRRSRSERHKTHLTTSGVKAHAKPINRKPYHVNDDMVGDIHPSSSLFS